MTRRRVITEREIQRSARAGDTTIDVAGAVVTPSARDAAARAKITLTGAGGSGNASGVRAGQAKPAPAGARPAGAKAAGEPPSKPTTKPGAPATPKPTAKLTDTPRPTVSATPATDGLTVALGADHGGVSMKAIVAERLRELGHRVLDFGTVTKDPVDYPDFAVAVGKAVAEGRAAMGVVIDGAGIGSCMAANKVRGVRAAMCYDVTTAANAREHNNANVLTLGAGLIGARLATAILDTFLATPFAGGRHKPRVDKIDALDRPG
jgi:ribose 5-phosphate isomerase B